MRFSSRRDLWVNILMYASIALLIFPLFPLFQEKFTLGSVGIAVFCIGVAVLLLWLLYGTYYIIDEANITYHSGPIRGKIEIDKIHTIVKGKSLYAGLRPATALNGLVIKYGKYDEIYFSPDSNESFIAEVLRINHRIKVEDNK